MQNTHNTDHPPENTQDTAGWLDWMQDVQNDDEGVERLIVACRAGVHIGGLLLEADQRALATNDKEPL